MSTSVRHSSVAQDEAEPSAGLYVRRNIVNFSHRPRHATDRYALITWTGQDTAMACTKETAKSSGLNIWSSEAATGPAPVVDIIAVQGLGSHEFYTWVNKVPSQNADKAKRFRNGAQFWKGKKPPQGKDDSGDDGLAECMWIRDCLVPMFKDARIATYSYKSDWKDRAVKTSLRECAELFLNVLLQYRQHVNEHQRPIVLIGHSLGCLVIQQALVLAALHQEFIDLRLSVTGIIFLGAPLQGSDAALFGKWLARSFQRDSTLLALLQKDSQPLFELSRDFWGSYYEWDLLCFYETRDAEYGPLKAQMVSPQSASLLGKRMIPLDTDHSGLNKFSGENDENFKLVPPCIGHPVGRIHIRMSVAHISVCWSYSSIGRIGLSQ